MLGHDRFEVTAKKFQVNDIQGNTLINVDKSLIEFSAGTLRVVEGDGGVIFRLVLPVFILGILFVQSEKSL